MTFFSGYLITDKRKNRLEAQRVAKRRKYAQIKLDPELYAREKERTRHRYLKKKEKGLVKPIAETSPRDQRIKRKKWREAACRYRQKKKDEKKTVKIPMPVMIIPTDEDVYR
ncbi:unnamed protein product [Diatraea saccharalis]|uniref:Uncharacterized protein n=1 Tax=Diatraea saccharalis TaxID=40085 RepID=A0A9N9R0G4_9NEOP|nr:unnamed protein product [Diatraea saccharalis]